MFLFTDKNSQQPFLRKSLTLELVIFFQILCALSKQIKDSLPDTHTRCSVKVRILKNPSLFSYKTKGNTNLVGLGSWSESMASVTLYLNIWLWRYLNIWLPISVSISYSVSIRYRQSLFSTDTASSFLMALESTLRRPAQHLAESFLSLHKFSTDPSRNSGNGRWTSET